MYETLSKIGTCHFRPYRKGMGPWFKLETLDTGQSDRRGGWYIGYRLTEYDSGSATVLFEGYDFSASPMWAVDSDECMGCIMGFLTLRPGDTDEEYFEDYTPRQLEFCDQHAEHLGFEVYRRFGEV